MPSPDLGFPLMRTLHLHAPDPDRAIRLLSFCMDDKSRPAFSIKVYNMSGGADAAVTQVSPVVSTSGSRISKVPGGS